MLVYCICLGFGMASECVGESGLVPSLKDGTVGQLVAPYGALMMQT